MNDAQRFRLTPCSLFTLAIFLCGLNGSFQPMGFGQSAVGSIIGRVAAPASDNIAEEIIRGRKLLRYSSRHQHEDLDSIPLYRLSESAVVYLESVPRSAIPPKLPVRRPQLNQFQMVFRPLVLPIVAGTTVDFPNSDDLYHNVFSYSQPKEFDLGRYPKGKVKSVLFDEPGIVKVYCDIHSYMYATILVLDHPFFAVPDDDGNYTIPNVPEGKYELSYWYGRKKVESRHIMVQSGRTITEDFR